MDINAQALTLSLYGIGITFAALFVLILIIIFLKGIFPGHRSEKRFQFIKPEPKLEDEKLYKERVVAIAIAWWIMRNQRSRSLGDTLTKPRSGWWRHGNS